MKKIFSVLFSVLFFLSCAQNPKEELIDKLISVVKSSYSFPVETEFSTWVDMVKEDNSSVVYIYYVKDISGMSSREEMTNNLKNDAGMKKVFNEGVSLVFRYYNAQGDSLIREETFKPQDIL